MASTKLSAEDKKAIVKLYQKVGQTAATVAEQYGVSVSTISRLLKSELPPETYEALVRQKRGGGETKSQKSKKRTSRKKPVSKLKKAAANSNIPEVTEAVLDAPSGEDNAEKETAEASPEVEKAPARSRRTRSSAKKKRPVSRRKAKETVEAVSPEAAANAEDTTEDQVPEIVAVEAAVGGEETETGRQKPTRRTRPRLKQTVDVEAEEDTNIEQAEAPELTREEEETKPRRRTRRRTRAKAVAEELPEVAEIAPEDETADLVEADAADDLALDDLTDELGNEDEDFDDAFDDDDDLEDEDDGSDNITSLRRRSSAADVVQIQPLSEANLSRMLYLVIDRTADLITMPMVFFSDLGELPEEEEKKKTLPVFENHRVARRFSQRNQRVIKVPDGELISKTASWLEAKGITRCLLDGQVYSLESADL